MKPKDETKHLTTADLAARWDMSTGTLTNWRVLGLGPKFIKIGSRVLYSLAAVEEFERERERRNTQDE